MLDNEELELNPINKKFELLVQILNDEILGGYGEITLFDNNPRTMMLCSEERPNMLICFLYSTGHLTITLKYKFWQRELVCEKQFPYLRDLTDLRQQDIANEFIEMSTAKILEHQKKVNSELFGGYF
ncbi:MAG: hypothetical protein SPE05_08735 [Bacteroidales bacterium]|nr:hypothetical protein [Bacteroidales bacterium]